MKNVYGVNNSREEALVIDTPSDIMKNDAGNKKSTIYHPPIKAGKTHAQEKREYKEKCGDVRSIKLGYPMDWSKFMALSDDTKREYLESVFSKYPGINSSTICSIFNSCFKKDEINDEIIRLGFNFDGAGSVQVQGEISKAIYSEKKEETDAAAKKATKPKRITYEQLIKMPKNEALLYLQNLYDYYRRSLALKDFRKLFGVSEHTMRNRMMKVNFDISSFGSSKFSESLKTRELFYKEMMDEPFETHKAEDKTKNVESSTGKNGVKINSISIIADASDVDSIVEVLKSFSGTVRISIEKE